MPHSTDFKASGTYTDDQRARRAEGLPPVLVSYINGPQSIHEKIAGIGPSPSSNRMSDTKAGLDDWNRKWKLLAPKK